MVGPDSREVPLTGNQRLSGLINTWSSTILTLLVSLPYTHGSSRPDEHSDSLFLARYQVCEQFQEPLQTSVKMIWCLMGHIWESWCLRCSTPWNTQNAYFIQNTIHFFKAHLHRAVSRWYHAHNQSVLNDAMPQLVNLRFWRHCWHVLHLVIHGLILWLIVPVPQSNEAFLYTMSKEYNQQWQLVMALAAIAVMSVISIYTATCEVKQLWLSNECVTVIIVITFYSIHFGAYTIC